MKAAICALFMIVAASQAAAIQTFTGTITDDVCAKADHSQMQMGSNDAECAAACVSAHGAAYILYDGKNAYRLTGLERPEEFAGQRVRVAGVLDAKNKSIRVESIQRVNDRR